MGLSVGNVTDEKWVVREVWASAISQSTYPSATIMIHSNTDITMSSMLFCLIISRNGRTSRLFICSISGGRAFLFSVGGTSRTLGFRRPSDSARPSCACAVRCSFGACHTQRHICSEGNGRDAHHTCLTFFPSPLSLRSRAGPGPWLRWRRS
jgi:hypothetical protein